MHGNEDMHTINAATIDLLHDCVQYSSLYLNIVFLYIVTCKYTELLLVTLASEDWWLSKAGMLNKKT